MSTLIHFLNQKFVTEEELLISPRDLGYIRGYAVADFIVTYNNKPFKLAEHIDRLFNSAEIIGLHLPWTKEQIANWALETLHKNDTDSEKTMKIIVSGGESHSLHQADVPTLIMIVSQRMRKPAEDYEQGVKVRAVEYKRQYPEAKHTHYVEAIKQLAQAKAECIEEVIYYDNSQVFEGSGTNIFAVIDDILITPQSNIVFGITRDTILEVVELPIPVVVKDFAFEDLLRASEIFITGSNSEVRGVVEVNGKVIGEGKIGDITKEVAKQYKEYILQTIEK